MTGGSQATLWRVSRGQDGAYSVTVQGDEKSSPLTGSEDETSVVLTGFTNTTPALATQVRVTGTASTLSGRLLQTRAAPKAIKIKNAFGELERDLLCTVIWGVVASKQGS